MSDDFISRKALMDRVLQQEYDNDIHKDAKAKSIHHGEYRHFYKIIAEMPTAYDVDKVMERLEERKKYLLKEFVLADKAEEVKERAVARINEIDGIIEIIKSGGVENE